jgi:predicted kinase
MNREFTETRHDYSVGKTDAPELTITVGMSGCGKSTWAKEEVYRSRGRIVRLNRDDMRAMMFPKVEYNKSNENIVRNWQMEGARQALMAGRDVIIDDTNCIRQTRQKWEELAQAMHIKFKIVMFNTDFKTCVERDAARAVACDKCGKALGVMVGQGVIARQRKDLGERASEMPAKEYKLTRPYFERTEYLAKGGWTVRLPNAKWKLYDMDGTLCNHLGVRDPYDESRVLEDKPWESVLEMLREDYTKFNICVVSGRHDHCGDDSCDWMEMHAAPFDHILMRYSGDNRSDAIVKNEILNELTAVIGKDNIEEVVDDRPRVCEMWRSHGIRVKQVHGGKVVENPETATKHADGCAYAKQKGYRKCPDCAALEYF